MNQERRIFEREPIIMEIEAKGQYPGQIFRLLDMSLGGFKIETNFYLKIGQSFAFQFSLPEGEHLCRLTGEVVWVMQIPANPAHYRMGLKFPAPLKKLPDLFSLPLTQEEQAGLT
jgi:hypothetical protein